MSKKEAITQENKTDPLVRKLLDKLLKIERTIPDGVVNDRSCHCCREKFEIIQKISDILFEKIEV